MTSTHTKSSRRGFMQSALYAGALLAAGRAGAQAPSDYPRRPVTIIVPFSAGGAVDATARAVALVLTKQVGQSFIVENKAGAGGMLGLGLVARSAPDGYTLGWSSNSSLTVAPYVTRNPPFDPAKAFAPVSTATISSWAILARPGLPVGNLQELVALAKAKPGTVNFGSTGTGAVSHLLFEMLKNSAGIDMLHVPFKGESDGVTALLAGTIDLFLVATSTSTPLVNSGRMKALAVTAPGREKVLPNVPTVAEAGYPDLTFEFFVGLIAPAGTPAPIIARLAGAMKQAVAEPSLVEAMDKGGIVPMSTSPEEFTALIGRHSSRWQQVIRRNNIVVE